MKSSSVRSIGFCCDWKLRSRRINWPHLPVRLRFYTSIAWKNFPTRMPKICLKCRPCGETRWPHISPLRIITGRSSKNWPPLWSWLAATARTPTPFSRIQQIGDGTPFSIRAEWSKARRRGHSGLTQRTSAVYAIWWWWCSVRVTIRAKASVYARLFAALNISACYELCCHFYRRMFIKTRADISPPAGPCDLSLGHDIISPSINNRQLDE